MSDNRSQTEAFSSVVDPSDKGMVSDGSRGLDSCLQKLPEGRLPALDRLGQRASEYVAHARATNTLRAYRSDWQHFADWCSKQRLEALPAAPETVGLYLSDLAQQCKVSTLRRRVSSISQAHQAAGLESPTRSLKVRAVFAGIRRVHGVAEEGKAPALSEDVAAMVGALPRSLLGCRDRALLLLGFAGAFRRSELVSLDVADLEWKRDGLVAVVRRSKTDQEGEGMKKGIPYGDPRGHTCPCRAVKAWLKDSGIESGALFRPLSRGGKLLPGRLSDRAVARVVQRSAEAVGLDPAKFGGHSLRAGLVTSAALNDVPERVIMRQTGHRSARTLRKYIRDAELFRGNAAGQVGL